MADIQPEITKFKSAVYGEEVRDAMVSLANKLNSDVSSVAGFTDRLDTAESNVSKLIYKTNASVLIHGMYTESGGYFRFDRIYIRKASNWNKPWSNVLPDVERVTTPNGVEGAIQLAATEAFVYNIDTSDFEIINQYPLHASTYILILSNTNEGDIQYGAGVTAALSEKIKDLKNFDMQFTREMFIENSTTSNDSMAMLSFPTSLKRLNTRIPIPVKKGDSISIKSPNYLIVYWYDKDGNFISDSGWTDYRYTRVAPEDGYCHIHLSQSDRYQTNITWTNEEKDELISALTLTRTDEGTQLETSLLEIIDPVSRSFERDVRSVIDTDVSKKFVNKDHLFFKAWEDAYKELLDYQAFDRRKIPFIAFTDQHGAFSLPSLRQFVKIISGVINWDNMSKIFNLGDTINNNWPISADAESGLSRMAYTPLDNFNYVMNEFPKGKIVHVFGNHDTWGVGWSDPSLGHATIPLGFLNPYFNNYPNPGFEPYPDNSGNFVIRDESFHIKYLAIANWDFANPITSNATRVSTEHWNWIIDELSKDDGCDIIMATHIPLKFISGTSKNPFTGVTSSSTSIFADGIDVLLADRKLKRAGSFTDSSGVVHNYDFTNVKTELLCHICGHTHADIYDYVGDQLLSVSYNRYTDAQKYFYFNVVDKVNRVLKVWQVGMPDTNNSSEQVEHIARYTLPLDPS